jgi:hypothetical protein
VVDLVLVNCGFKLGLFGEKMAYFSSHRGTEYIRRRQAMAGQAEAGKHRRQGNQTIGCDLDFGGHNWLKVESF